MKLFKRKSIEEQTKELEAKKKQADIKVKNANLKKEIRMANKEAFDESNIGRFSNQIKESLKKKREQNKLNQISEKTPSKKSQLDINNREKQDNYIKNFKI